MPRLGVVVLMLTAIPTCGRGDEDFSTWDAGGKREQWCAREVEGDGTRCAGGFAGVDTVFVVVALFVTVAASSPPLAERCGA
jgi:hypothetical protein